MSQNAKKTIISIITMDEPAGVSNTMEINKPTAEQHIEIIADQTVTDLKLLKIRIADKAGKIISAEINREPTRFMASTIIIAIIVAIIVLYNSVFIPVDFENSSSNVTQKILL